MWLSFSQERRPSRRVVRAVHRASAGWLRRGGAVAVAKALIRQLLAMQSAAMVVPSVLVTNLHTRALSPHHGTQYWPPHQPSAATIGTGRIPNLTAISMACWENTLNSLLHLPQRSVSGWGGPFRSSTASAHGGLGGSTSQPMDLAAGSWCKRRLES
ncbi:hypothetical protein Q31a_15760 [Aureliella helgolandensis]|uniref:Uncharacterized protein n=1 Tax=Aureliella helgolandensis TaxID=2527968 RepID=A0A518G3V1_9BACT|nr:hypothetical protein Q31a_15760 [Aureliella helgolandensis]